MENYDWDDYDLDEKWLKEIAEWPITNIKDFNNLMTYIRGIWAYVGLSWAQDGNVYRISTVGWSWNEDIIAALQKNEIFWLVYWQESRRGGHYVFGPIEDFIYKYDLPEEEKCLH